MISVTAMTSKELVLRNYSFQSVPRFTIDFCAESKIYEQLKQHYQVATDLDLMEKLHVDFRYPKPQWIGFPLVDAQGRPTDYFGIPRAGAGDFGYAVEHPLANVTTVAEVEAYNRWPTADMWDYDQYAADCAKFEEYAVLGGTWGWFFEAACELVGMDRWFLLLYDHPEVAHAILERVVSFMERTSEIMFEKAGRYIDICFTGDDYGFQAGPCMSTRHFAEFTRPYLQRIYNVGRKNEKPVMHHSCGSVAKWIPTFMEMGFEHPGADPGGRGRHEPARPGRGLRRQALLPRFDRHAEDAAVRHTRGCPQGSEGSSGDVPSLRRVHHLAVAASDDGHPGGQHRGHVRRGLGIRLAVAPQPADAASN